MNDFTRQLEPMLAGDDLVRRLTALPQVRECESVAERLVSLLDVYKVYIPSQDTLEIYRRLYLATVESLERKGTKAETERRVSNYLASKEIRRYGVIGGLDSFKVLGRAGLGKSTAVRKCAEAISGGRVIKSESPYREIVPILFAECVADGSFKSLLYAILGAVDQALETTYLRANKRANATVDDLLCAASNVLANHVGVLVIDEIERVANESRKGETLMNYLTQLVNQSGIAICFVGNEGSDAYFRSREYLGRRTIGMTMRPWAYDAYFCSFIGVLFGYQYTERKIAPSAEIARLFHSLSGGIPATIVALFAESEAKAISSGAEAITPELVKGVYRESFSNVSAFVEGQVETRHKPLRDEALPIKEAEQAGDSISLSAICRAHKRDPEGLLDAISRAVGLEYV